MVLGELTEESTQYGKQAVTVKPIAGAELSEQLSDAIANIHAEITEPVSYTHLEGGKRPPVHDNRFTLLVNMI